MAEFTTEDFEGLPRWAVVAIAARAAERVVGLYKGPDDGAVLKAIAVAADAARNAFADDAATPRAESAESAADTRNMYAGTGAATAAARAAAAAADAASFASFAAATAHAANTAAQAAIAACSGRVVDPIDIDAVDHGTKRDIDLARAMAKAEGWFENTPVPPSVLGPLWPDRRPGWLPVEEVKPEETEQAIYLEVHAPEDATDEEVQALVEEAAARFSALHIAYGGKGLKVDASEVFDPTPVLEGAS